MLIKTHAHLDYPDFAFDFEDVCDFAEATSVLVLLRSLGREGSDDLVEPRIAAQGVPLRV